MSLYKKKPIAVEARQFDGTNGPELAEWCGGNFGPAGEHHVIDIHTMEGTMTASVGWWIIKGVRGEFYPVEDSIFRETYEPVDES